MTEILIIEDIDSDAKVLVHALGVAGIVNPVRCLTSGTEALRYLLNAATIAPVADSIPSVVFLDLKLPGVHGFEILSQISAMPAFSKTLRIVLSTLDDTKTIKVAYNFGAQTFLVKPFRQADLTELISAFPAHWIFRQ